MAAFRGLQQPKHPDWQAFIDNIRRRGTPKRVHHIELYHDAEIRDAIAERFGLMAGVKKNDPNYGRKKLIAVNRFCGFDIVQSGLVGCAMTYNWLPAEDTAKLRRQAGRNFMDEHAGPITNWEDFQKYPWPDPNAPQATSDLEWFQANLPEGMCLSCQTGHFAENLAWLMGYETLCYALYDQRDLVEALATRILEYHVAELKRILEIDCVKVIWGSDDMGHKTGLLISPDDMRQLVLSGHKVLAEMAHAAGRLYMLHSCGKLSDVIDDLIDDVKLDAKHSFEDTIEDVRDAKRTHGHRLALLGGIDMDFLCRSDETAIRKRVRDTLDVCMSGGGYCLGTGNTAANYIPLDNYLTMVDEGMLYAP
jgi:uroporphyrinogen decarboxylase